MEVYERIKDLRKNHLHLSQTAFGEKLGVSRSVSMAEKLLEEGRAYSLGSLIHNDDVVS